ncbi:MAG: hypothetical protein RLZZ436_3260 [Planctomycetota bacterium]|jgi:alkylated DNA repair dioxygenase AlkB
MEIRRLDLSDGGWMLWIPDFLSGEVADQHFQILLESPIWEQKPALFGHPQPRLTAAYGDPGTSYRYSRTANAALPWSPGLHELREQIEMVEGRYNYCLLNRYRSGRDSMGLHADNEPWVGNVIASLSLGAKRTFCIRHNFTGETQRFGLTHGSLLIMAGTMQEYWKHEIPKTRRLVGERINLTFRQIRGE